MPEWYEKPTSITDWPEDIKYIMFVDESGHANLRSVRRSLREGTSVNIGEKFLVITGLIIKRPNFPLVRHSTIALKEKYWPPEGLYFYEKKSEFRRVCLHSEDIRKHHKPFDFDCDTDYSNFIIDLSQFMSDTPYKILAAALNKQRLVQCYTNPAHPYNLCMNFILERFSQFFLRRNSEKGIIILESRGKKEDANLLKHLVRLLQSGTSYVSSTTLQQIRGIYFNTKWCEESLCRRSYIGNELADLVAYPIHKYVRDGIKDRAFEIIEKKLDCYPKYMGRGLKHFP